jgi:glycerophosphoryl diester phosphodiesterase
MPRPCWTEIIAHRGSSFLAPENTLAAFQLGWQETTTCEADVHLTADGRLVVIHDATTARTTGVSYKVGAHTLDSLQSLEAGSWKGPQWHGERIPTLKEVIDAMPVDKQLLIELKAEPEIIPELKRVIEASGKAERLRLQAFSYATCVAVREAFPEIAVYLLIEAKPSLLSGEWRPSIDEIMAKTRDGGLDGIGLNDTGLLSDDAMHTLHADGLKVLVWTVDQVGEAQRLLDLKVDGIITNRPGWLKAGLALD